MAKVCNELIIAGCHSGNLLVINSASKNIETVDQAHNNLIRAVVSLDYSY
jgi:hypothetical protein